MAGLWSSLLNLYEVKFEDVKSCGGSWDITYACVCELCEVSSRQGFDIRVKCVLCCG